MFSNPVTEDVGDHGTVLTSSLAVDCSADGGEKVPRTAGGHSALKTVSGHTDQLEGVRVDLSHGEGVGTAPVIPRQVEAQAHLHYVPLL